jgi:TorA maturation chaperone TorD
MNSAEQKTDIAIEPEDQARANIYALIARLFGNGPDDKLMQAIAGADEMTGSDDDAPLAAAWNKLQQAAALVPYDAASEEHQILFVGVGKSEVSPYATHYEPKVGSLQFLAAVRGALDEMGLARRGASSEPEDHMAALADVMRFLAAGDGSTLPADVATQQAFFTTYVAPWYADFFQAVETSKTANFYRCVAQFSQAFFQVEAESFQIE